MKYSPQYVFYSEQQTPITNITKLLLKVLTVFILSYAEVKPSIKALVIMVSKFKIIYLK